MSMVLAKAAADEADRTHALVRALNSAVARMGRAVGLISSIAGQTAKATAEISKPGLAGPGLTGHAVSAIRPDPAALGEFYRSSPTLLPPSRAPRRS
jgi:hypothetical protein